MLTEEIKNEIDNVIKHFPRKSAACTEALKIVQQHHGWVSDENVQAIAKYLDMSSEQVDSVATFYSLVFRQPVGRHVILVCDSISCFIMGYEKIVEKLKEKLNIDWGQTTEDERFTLLPIPCLGNCDHAPTLMIDNDLHQDITVENIDKILNQYK
ncbi:MAG: NADH-quinone oxidoreductase subunit NuoE [Fulvivirga sp.]|nr:NADH-quinone oxidoreductase subunit NuoE [Fulvivirga sp.]